jgi:epoxyqueuosine reductase QueG
VHEQHLDPRAFLKRHSPPESDLTHVRVIVWVLPFAPEVRRSNQKRSHPSRLYSLARNNGGALIYRMSLRLLEVLRDQGAAAAAPTVTAEYDVSRVPGFTFSSTWSQRHAAYCAGLGRFGLNGALITPLGINVRLGSVATALPLEPTPRKHDDHRAPCLQDQGESCGLCRDRCPADAISSQGLDKNRCQRFRKEIREKYLKRYLQEMKLLPTPISINGEMRDRYSLGCALCQCGVPCEERDPFAASEGENVNAGY